jgi:hypothetical protein
MTAAASTNERQVIPRWRDLLATAKHGEFGERRRREPTAPDDRSIEALSERLHDFQRHHTMSFAADLLTASVVLGPTPETKRAAELIVATPNAPAMVRDTAAWVIHGGDRGDTHPSERKTEKYEDRDQIRRLRRGLHANPRNALRWAELSRHYINEGHERQATTAMRIAVNMAPFDRYILRSAVRLWTHLADPEQAARTLVHARSLVITDPWLLASEIATAATTKRPSRNIKRGREMIEASTHSSFALSELASALATIEMQAGAAKRARRLFRSALIDPNENSVAQAEWASGRLAGDIGLRHEQRELSAEARARRFADDDENDTALDATWDWLNDQPFSTEPASFGSYRASMCGYFEAGIKFARAGLIPNPSNALLLNNLAFSQANTGALRDACETLAKVRADEEGWMRPTLTATRGFVAFRSGEVEKGRNLYRQAIETMPNTEQRLRAELMLASEEARIDAPDSEIITTVLESIARANDPHLKTWARYVVARTARHS